MKTNDKPEFEARLDRRLLTDRGGVRHLLVDVTAPEIAPPEGDDRPPLHLALVIDASGSMAGPPLEAAQAAARGVVEALGPDDRITVVSFADEVITHVAGESASDGGRDKALHEIGLITPRGCTDLCGGWRTGVEHLVGLDLPGAQRRAVILSDGHANRGVTDPEQLGLEAAAARDRGVYTTSVGIGDGYSTTQLLALCENGGGHLHHAARPQEIIEVVLGELGQILTTVAEGVRLRLDLPSGVTAAAVGPFPTHDGAGGQVVDVGTFISGARRRIPIRLHCPPAAVGDRLTVLVTPTWRAPGDEAEQTGATLDVGLLYAPVDEVATERPDTAACLEIGRAWQRELIDRATAMVEEGDREGARSFLDEARGDFADYLRDLPGGEEVLAGLDHFRHRLQRSFSQGLAKEVRCCLRQDSTLVSDLRWSASFCMEDIDKMG